MVRKGTKAQLLACLFFAPLSRQRRDETNPQSRELFSIFIENVPGDCFVSSVMNFVLSVFIVFIKTLS